MSGSRLKFLKFLSAVQASAILLFAALCVLSFLFMVLLPIGQQIIHWLEYESWLRRDVQWLLDIPAGSTLSSWRGVDRILRSVVSMHSAIAWFLLIIPSTTLFFWGADKSANYFESVESEIEKLEAELNEVATTPADVRLGLTDQVNESQLGRALRVIKTFFLLVYGIFATILIWGFAAILIVTILAALFGF